MTQALMSSIDVVQRAVTAQLRAVSYLRVSTEEQTKGYGIAYTDKKTTAHMRRKGWAHVGTFADEGESGTLPWQQRPDAKRLMDLTDELWGQVSRSMPPFQVRKNSLDPRAVVEAVLYKLRTGTGWESLPDRFPAGPSVQARVKAWIKSGAWVQMMEPLLSPDAKRFERPLLPALKVTGELDPNLSVLLDGRQHYGS
ncbi:transposase [Streptomyces sp. NBC_01485]|uniref:transposase n=1 Tax=Streptomyces sp. NBC_01485 TaxID=2903884 RepID=UPI002E2ED56F|nr:transposase [Streptomyces sp. NBC_01485]